MQAHEGVARGGGEIFDAQAAQDINHVIAAAAGVSDTFCPRGGFDIARRSTRAAWFLTRGLGILLSTGRQRRHSGSQSTHGGGSLQESSTLRAILFLVGHERFLAIPAPG